ELRREGVAPPLEHLADAGGRRARRLRGAAGGASVGGEVVAADDAWLAPGLVTAPPRLVDRDDHAAPVDDRDPRGERVERGLEEAPGLLEDGLGPPPRPAEHADEDATEHEAAEPQHEIGRASCRERGERAGGG